MSLANERSTVLRKRPYALTAQKRTRCKNYFVLCAQRTNEHVHYLRTFMAEISSGPARLVLATAP